MKLKRRDFLKGFAGSAILASLAPAPVFCQEATTGDAKGILYDATQCIGCQVCMVACKQANKIPEEHTGKEKMWDNPVDLSAITLNIIKKYEHGNASEKDEEINGYSFIKRQCMHCLKPACASACPVSALEKDISSGIVKYDSSRCIGCRYCQVACPFNVPKFEWDNPFPKIVKCQMCDHLVSKDGAAACCTACPTGASLFGTTDNLMKEAKKRLKMMPGKYYKFPIGHMEKGNTIIHMSRKYTGDIFGESEVGGTQVIMLAGVPFGKTGLPVLPDKSFAALTESIQHSLYNKMILPAALLGGLSLLIANRKNKDE